MHLFILLIWSIVQFVSNSTANITECPAIRFSNGFVKTLTNQPCTLSLTGSTTRITYSDCSQASGRWYGLVEYNLSSCSGTEYSPITSCDDCVLCLHNEIIEKCRSFWLPFLIGAFTIIMILVIVYILTRLYAYRIYRSLLHKWNNWRIRRRRNEDRYVLEALSRVQQEARHDSKLPMPPGPQHHDQE